MDKVFNKNSRELRKIFRQARKFGGGNGEKEAVMRAVRASLSENPLPPAAEPSWAGGFALSVIFHPHSSRKIWVGSAAAFGVLLLFGGTALASGSALPGDFLYPFKIGVTENISSMLTFGQDADARLEVSRASERLDEIKKLAARGKISDSQITEVRENFDAHSRAAQRIINSMATDGEGAQAKIIRAEFTNSLMSHRATFTLISETSAENRQSMNEMNREIEIYLPAGGR